MILGLDISTSITGITILSEDNKIIYNGYCDLKKQKCFFEKAGIIENELEKIINNKDINITSVFIEQSLQTFRSGYSSAQTLSTLAKFNGVVSWIVYKSLNMKPQYISAVSARSKCGIKVPRGEKAKIVVINYLLDNEPSFDVEYTKFGNIKAHYYDMADSLIIARAGLETKKELDIAL